jgi:hypothetical protein
MCYHCNSSGANQAYINLIETWADNGLPHSKITVLARPTAETYPNTFVFIFENAVTVDGLPYNVYVDVHYIGAAITAGAGIVAIGGLWIKGFRGGMKPSQHGGELLLQLQAELPSNAPSGGIAGVWGDLAGNAALPHGLTHTLGAPKDIYSLSGWGNSVPPKRK